ncbi:MAG TPA: hypothetical protein VJ206_07560 [bacterium]|nr:hypothetical protein [bacterium]
MTQRTWTTAEKVTASQLNVMIRDDLNYLYGPRPGCRAHHDQAAEAVANADGTYDFLPMAVTDEDTDEMRTITVDTTPTPASAFAQIKTAGKYLVTAQLTFLVDQAITTHGFEWGVQIIKRTSGTNTVIGAKQNPNSGNVGPSTHNCKTLWDFAVDDLIGLLPVIGSLFVGVHITNDRAALAVAWLGN